MTPRPAVEPKYSPGSPFRARPAPVIEEFVVDDRVTHDKFGLGTVIVRESAAVVVDFGAQRVRITSPYTKLTKI